MTLLLNYNTGCLFWSSSVLLVMLNFYFQMKSIFAIKVILGRVFGRNRILEFCILVSLVWISSRRVKAWLCFKCFDNDCSQIFWNYLEIITSKEEIEDRGAQESEVWNLGFEDPTMRQSIRRRSSHGDQKSCNCMRDTWRIMCKAAWIRARGDDADRLCRPKTGLNFILFMLYLFLGLVFS